MFEQDAEVLRRTVDAVNRGDRSAFLALSDPGLENIPPRQWPESEPIRGREAVWRFYTEANNLWEETSFEVAELVDVGDGRIVAHLRQEVQGKMSGARVRFSYWLLATARNGKGRRLEWFADRGEALAAGRANRGTG
jgi:ketosteroid isomerase-like protein